MSSASEDPVRPDGFTLLRTKLAPPIPVGVLLDRPTLVESLTSA